MSIATELREGWLVLRDRASGGGRLPTLGTGAHVGAGEILQALDDEGGRHVLVPVTTARVPEDRLSAGIQIVKLELGRTGATETYADIRCMLPRLADLFDDVAADMIEAAVASPDDPIPACVGALDQWRTLLRSVRGPAPGRFQIIGLIAELMVVRDVVERDPERRLDLWVGREGQRHDLRRGGVAIEVKATIAIEGRKVSIHGIHQLAAPEGGELYLRWFRFEHVPGGAVTLSALVDEIRSLGVPAQHVHAGLDERGIAPGTWEDEEFDLVETRMYRVGDGFPRIIDAMFEGGAVPEGVADVRYTVDLDQAGTALSDTDCGAVIGRLAVME